MLCDRRRLFERMRAETPDAAHLLVTVLAMEGLRSMKLFDSDILTAEERRLFVDRMLAMAAGPKVG